VSVLMGGSLDVSIFPHQASEREKSLLRWCDCSRLQSRAPRRFGLQMMHFTKFALTRFVRSRCSP
jgi:hypothetical protein